MPRPNKPSLGPSLWAVATMSVLCLTCGVQVFLWSHDVPSHLAPFVSHSALMSCAYTGGIVGLLLNRDNHRLWANCRSGLLAGMLLWLAFALLLSIVFGRLS